MVFKGFSVLRLVSVPIAARGSSRCLQEVTMREMNVEISELRKALNTTRQEIDTMRLNLTNQQKQVANLSTKVTISACHLLFYGGRVKYLTSKLATFTAG